MARPDPGPNSIDDRVRNLISELEWMRDELSPRGNTIPNNMAWLEIEAIVSVMCDLIPVLTKENRERGKQAPQRNRGKNGE